MCMCEPVCVCVCVYCSFLLLIISHKKLISCGSLLHFWRLFELHNWAVNANSGGKKEKEKELLTAKLTLICQLMHWLLNVLKFKKCSGKVNIAQNYTVLQEGLTEEEDRK